MNKNLPNQDNEQFGDLPMPDVNLSWQKMEQLLDKEKESRKPFIPVFFKTCAGWGLVLLLAAALGWFVLWPDVSKDKTNDTSKSAPVRNGLHENASILPSALEKNTVPEQQEAIKQDASATASQKNHVNKEVSILKTTKGIIRRPVAEKIFSSKEKLQKNKPDQSAETISPQLSKKILQDPDKTPTNISSQIQSDLAGEKRKDGTERNQTNDSIVTHHLSNDSLAGSNDIVADTSVNQKEAKDPVKDEVRKSNGKKNLMLSAGIGLQQQIPLDGQKAVPYNYYGRKSSLSDYIPSAYIRLEKERKWFVQGEFRFGAPQTLEDFAYSQQTRLDTSHIFLTTTTYRLKKTYYHQFPLSFNFYVKPRLSIGIGGIYSRFSGAVMEKEEKSLNIITQQESLSRQMVNQKQFNDSFLYKTQVHLLLQGEYHWKRFTFGLRYTRDVQPFIKYTQPDGSTDTRKNQTIQLMVRFRVWEKRL